jgi:hypothetical protein
MDGPKKNKKSPITSGFSVFHLIGMHSWITFGWEQKLELCKGFLHGRPDYPGRES